MRQNIISGAFPAGAPLKQEDLAARFGISMGSLREALRTLHSDGLVKIMPNRGAQVTDLSAEEAEEIFDIRSFLELGALELALPNLTEKDFTAAEKILGKMDNAKDSSKWAELNREFHDALYRPAGRPRLLSMLGNLHDNVGRYLRLYLDTLNFQSESQSEHYALIKACRQNELPLAKKILRKHLIDAREKLAAYLTARNR